MDDTQKKYGAISQRMAGCQGDYYSSGASYNNADRVRLGSVYDDSAIWSLRHRLGQEFRYAHGR